MKKCIFSCILLIWSATSAVAQRPDVNDVWQRQLRVQRTGMYTLAGWSAANLAVSAVAVGQTEGTAKYFHEMNLYWNAVNLGIAGLGFLSLKKQRAKTATLAGVVEQQNSLEKTLLFNGGLDVAYVAGGFYLLEKAKNEPNQQDRLKGFGQAVMVQGGFLLLFDVANYAIHTSNNPKIKRVLERVDLGGGGISLRF